ncbi:hypothetical protein CCHL11_00470 [Colletotrichum chlorophyti]|uniref:Uncharacterized protein n=1 Tax=Colletotrichum chlorophyti TaxID=708187 RepID=A0A1Q8RVE2_9PEZI|nr:hypothetical protein CCHL11_00470 [Colletotrichum chlorophyti]
MELLRALKRLTRLVIDHETSFTRQLVETLRKYNRECLLDLRHFGVRYSDDSGPDPRDLALLSSPQLHSISVKEYNSASPDHINEMAVLRLVKERVPRLREVHLEPGLCARRSLPEDVQIRFVDHLQGLISKKAPKGQNPRSDEYTVALQLGSWCSLSLGKVTPTRLEAWFEAFILPRCAI